MAYVRRELAVRAEEATVELEGGEEREGFGPGEEGCGAAATLGGEEAESRAHGC